MGILDEAIREHLELKRQHGADNSELKQLEDEAFGPPERPGSGEEAPDPLAEAPTEFMSQPEGLEEETGLEAGGESAEAESDVPPAGRRESAAGILDLQEAPAPVEPSEEEQPAGEYETVPEPEPEPEPEVEVEPEPDEEPEAEPEPPRSRGEESDVLEGTPDFLEEAPEDDELWFEQKPPKDFDFDD
jgi:hypothetical protein